ncbi:hypothetical protein B7P43_G02129 [Cryptotermes secundus]|uniref:Hsp70-interacting protein N-terminal domain-containing protein n=1 Tax=Cryptotermes secundus TaxID=105785 RepID=A0A2J7PYC0_9NEOP|nr:hypothetical protein B7P43_G02129 [Cryptotermes secundus]
MGWTESESEFESQKGQEFSLLQIVHTSSGVHPTSYPMGTRDSSVGVKQLECEADYSPPTSVKVKKMWIYISTPPYAFKACTMPKLPFTAAHLSQLNGFVDLCKNDPKILLSPELAFFKNYIESLGGKIPATLSETDFESPKADILEPEPEPEPKPRKAKEPEAQPEPEVESEESDIELDNSGIIGFLKEQIRGFHDLLRQNPTSLFMLMGRSSISMAPTKDVIHVLDLGGEDGEPDFDEPQAMGGSDKEVTEEDIEKSDEKKREAIEAFAAGEFQKTVDIYTEAILLNPGSALLYAKRGQCFLKLNKPNACIRDCSRALEINPDNAAAYKFRGRAHRLLGQWEEAVQDLRNACKIDFDEQADEWLREVTPNIYKVEKLQLQLEASQLGRLQNTEKEIIRKTNRMFSLKDNRWLSVSCQI